MRKFKVTGMNCAACSSRVETTVSQLPGMRECNVNLLTGIMAVDSDIPDDEIIAAVKNAGYSASLYSNSESGKKVKEEKNDDFSQLKKRFISSVVFLLILMYFSMGHMMWNRPLPPFLNDNHIAIGLVQLLLTTVIMVINQRFFISGTKALIHRSPNMDTLVSLGSATAFIYSLYALFAMTDAAVKGNSEQVMHYMHEFYFESAAMILTLITVGKMLEAYSKGKTTNALKALSNLAPKNATVIRDGKETVINISELKKNDVFIVKPGESIPADGTVNEGESSVDESALTGESVPVDKKPGDKVAAATINKYGFIKCTATDVGEDTTLGKIIQMVSDASSGKAPIAKIADKVSGVFVPTVIAIAVITTIMWLILGESSGFALARGISVLVISCPCALGLATPVAIMVGSGVGAKNGILFKTAEALEETGKIKVAVFDKTGTITMGNPSVTDVYTVDDISEEHFLRLVYSLEKKSEHPLGKAICSYCDEKNIPFEESSEFTVLPGSGLSAVIGNSKVLGTNVKYMSEAQKADKKFTDIAEKYAESGKTPMIFSENDKIIGIIAVADTIKPDSKEAIERIKKMGIKTVMLTGDNKKTAAAIGKECGVDETIADVLPDEKANKVNEYKKYGNVAMIGDGINDAPALTVADTGIAIGAGTDVAIDAADIVLVKSSLDDAASAVTLSRATLKNIKENLFWAFIYNIIGIPLAAGVWIYAFGWKLNPMFGAAAMSLSSFCVVMNALRLNFVKLKSKSKK